MLVFYFLSYRVWVYFNVINAHWRFPYGTTVKSIILSKIQNIFIRNMLNAFNFYKLYDRFSFKLKLTRMCTAYAIKTKTGYHKIRNTWAYTSTFSRVYVFRNFNCLLSISMLSNILVLKNAPFLPIPHFFSLCVTPC